MVKSYLSSKSGYFEWIKQLKPVFDNKIGVFVDLGFKQNCKDGDGIVRGFPLHILRASRTSIEKRYDGCNVKQQLFAHLLGALLFSFTMSKPLNLSYVPITFDGRWLRTNGLANAIRAE